MGVIISVAMGTIYVPLRLVGCLPNQKIVIASAKQVANGDEELPGRTLP